MFKLNRAAAIETGKVILFSIVVAVATALIVNFVKCFIIKGMNFAGNAKENGQFQEQLQVTHVAERIV